MTRELTVEAGGLRVTVAADGVDLWRTTRAAFEAAENICCSPACKTTTNVRRPARATHRPKGSKAERVRQIAQELLADGKIHERREISKAVRDEGLSGHLVNSALDGHFEKGHNSLGRPTYRDRSVPSGYNTESPADSDKPAWMRDRVPAEPKPPAAVGKWTADGIVPVERNGEPAGTS